MKLTAGFLFAVCLFIQQNVAAQNCGSCNRPPKVCHYDFFVLEQKPDDAAKSAEWQQLFWLAKFSQNYIFNHNKGCIRFIDPIATRVSGNQTILIGLTEPVLPPTNIPKSVDYIITGGVVEFEGAYLLQIQLQAACTKESIAKAEVKFHSSADANYIQNIAEQAASQISPIDGKIKTYAERKRQENVKVAFGNSGSQSISVVPKTSKLASGQETDVDISLTDCDGTPLANREISFDKASIEGFDIKGTTGGTVSPARVTTDGSGKAKVKFKMGPTKTAFIRAHYIFNRPSGCQDAMIGSAPIGGIPIKVTLIYETYQEQSMDPSIWSPMIKGDKTRQTFSRSHNTVLYFYPKDPKSPYLIVTTPEAKAGESIFDVDKGDFSYSGRFPAINLDIESGPMHLHQELSRDSVVTNSGSAQKNKPSDITFFLGNELDRMYFAIDFNYTNEEDENDIGTGPFPGGITVSKGDYNSKFTIKKITDPKSPYKTDYLIQLERDPGSLKEVSKDIKKDLTGIQDITGYRGNELLAVHILSPY